MSSPSYWLRGLREPGRRKSAGGSRYAPSPIPAVLLARLAVDRSVQGRGIGAFLLRDAMYRALSASAELGIRIMLLHALDESAQGFYLHHGFETSRTDPMNLQLLMKDIEASAAIRPA